jgi:hypothetical protein
MTNRPASFLLATALFFAAASAAPTNAQQQPPSLAGIGLDVSPAKVDFAIPAGARYTMPMTVSNPGANSTHVVVTPVDFKLSGKGDYEFLKVGSVPYSLMKYATVNPREFDIPPQTTQQVQVTISMPPASVASGEYAGIVIFQTRPERRAHQALAFSTRIASKFYCVIRDTERPGGEVTNVVAANQGAGEDYQITFRNSGNTHLYLGGFVEIRKGADTIDKIKLPDGMLVERGNDRLIEVTGKRLPPGQYQVIAAVDYGGKKLSGGAVNFTVQ